MRFYVIKLFKFIVNKFMENKVEENIFNLVVFLVEIIKICYSIMYELNKVFFVFIIKCLFLLFYVR